MKNLILNAAWLDFSASFFPVFRIITVVLIAICAVIMIISTLLQSSADENGATAITGQESYYSQNKGETRDGKLKKLTVICAIVIAVCTVLYFVSYAFIG